MEPPQESKMYQPYRSPVRILSPPLSPPPTSPLPLPPSASKRTQNNDVTLAVRELRSQMSLPNLEYRRQHSMDTKTSAPYRNPTSNRLGLPCNLGSSALKSSSESDLSGIKQTQRLSIARDPIDLSDCNTSVSKATKSPSRPSVQSSVNLTWTSSPQRRIEGPETSETIRKSNRSRKTPRRAIARSPLYIPVSHDAKQDTKRQSNNDDRVPDLEGDGITSLPRCPSGDDLTRFALQDRFNDSAKKPWVRNSELCGMYDRRNAALITRPSGSMRRKLSKARIEQPNMVNQNMKPSSAFTRRTKGELIAPLLQSSHREEDTVTPLVHREVMNGEEQNATSILGHEVQHQPWYVRRQRLIWIFLTVIFILLATGGVLGGALWRISRR